MNEQRAFTFVVTGCSNCPSARIIKIGYGICSEITTAGIDDHEIYKQNKDAITPTCPMWNEAKPIGELK